MQCLIAVFFVVVSVSAEPPTFNSRFSNQFQRQEQPPYQPSGWRPSGPQFTLPSRQQTPPSEYGPPTQYLPPQENSTDIPDTATTQDPATYDYLDQLEEAPKKNETKSEQLNESSEVKEEGAYYIYHPSGLLQRVTYVTNKNKPNMEFTAQLRYKNVEPIRGPIFTYDPETLVFSRVQP